MFHVPEEYRLLNGKYGSDKSYGNNGVFIIPFESYTLRMVISDGLGWEHVSVSLNNRCPNWKEMCFIKDTFWDEEDTVIQYHPAKSEYINCCTNCLHLWRLIGREIPTPPKIMVGI